MSPLEHFIASQSKLCGDKSKMASNAKVLMYKNTPATCLITQQIPVDETEASKTELLANSLSLLKGETLKMTSKALQINAAAIPN